MIHLIYKTKYRLCLNCKFFLTNCFDNGKRRHSIQLDVSVANYIILLHYDIIAEMKYVFPN